MKIYEEVARLEVKEAIQNGVSAQNRKRLLKANHSQSELTAEKRDELFRTLFGQGKLPVAPKHRSGSHLFILFCFLVFMVVIVSAIYL